MRGSIVESPKTDPSRGPGLRINQIILAAAEFRHRENFLTLPARAASEDLEVRLDVGLAGRPDGKGVALSVKVSTNPQDLDALYQFSVELVALVEQLSDEANMSPLNFVAGAGLTTLFPFIREVVANLTMRGRFGPIWLRPINVKLAVEHLHGQLATPVESKARAKSPRAKTRK